MADQHLSTAVKKPKKKDRGIVKFFRDLIKQQESANDLGHLASQSNNTTPVSVSAFGRHEAGSAEPSASGKYIDSIIFDLGVIDNDLKLASPVPTTPFQSALASPDLPGSAVAQGELQYA
jgi:hypothetical protein